MLYGEGDDVTDGDCDVIFGHSTSARSTTVIEEVKCEEVDVELDCSGALVDEVAAAVELYSPP